MEDMQMGKEKKNSLQFPKVGQRIIRSIVAVACCFVVFYLRNKEGIPFYSALAVLQCIQPYQDSMAETARKRVTGTLVGAFWGLVIILIQLYAFDGVLKGSFAGYMYRRSHLFNTCPELQEHRLFFLRSIFEHHSHAYDRCKSVSVCI